MSRVCKVLKYSRKMCIQSDRATVSRVIEHDRFRAFWPCVACGTCVEQGLGSFRLTALHKQHGCEKRPVGVVSFVKTGAHGTTTM